MNLFHGSFLDINVSPGRIIFSDNISLQLIEVLSNIGDNAGIISTSSCKERYYPRLGYIDSHFSEFSGRITETEINKHTEFFESKNIDFVIGLGGGKAIDCAKCVAFNLRKPFIAMPTSSATCASFTSLAVIYNEKNEFESYKYLNTPPVIVFLDSKILREAPDRLLAAGIGDTIAKYVETVSSAGISPEDLFSNYSLEIANKCIEICTESTKCGISTDKKERDNINFANIILSGLSSGIGGMSCFATIAHALANGITKLEHGDKILHGEAIAYTILLEMIIEDFPVDEFQFMVNLFRKCKLPCNSKELNNISGLVLREEELEIIYAHSQHRDETANLAKKKFTHEELILAFKYLENLKF